MSPIWCKIENQRVGFVIRVCRCERDLSLDRAHRKPFVIGAERGVCDGPSSSDKSDSLVVSPIMRIGRIVHAHFKVLVTSEEKIPVV